MGGVCGGALKLPGFWEIPMCATFETANAANPLHLMDPWLDSTDNDAVLEWLEEAFPASPRGRCRGGQLAKGPSLPLGIAAHTDHNGSMLAKMSVCTLPHLLAT